MSLSSALSGLADNATKVIGALAGLESAKAKPATPAAPVKPAPSHTLWWVALGVAGVGLVVYLVARK